MSKNITIVQECHMYDQYILQGSPNIIKAYNTNAYATDAVMALALALNETYENPFLNGSIQSALEAIMFSGASVSSIKTHSETNLKFIFFFVRAL